MRGGLFRFHFAATQTPTTFICNPSKVINYFDGLPWSTGFWDLYIARKEDAAAFYRKPSSLFAQRRRVLKSISAGSYAT